MKIFDNRTYKLGRIVGADRTLGITDEQRSVHMHVIGASGSGKSKMLEHLIRQDIVRRRGLCLIDPHGTLARDVLAWASSLPMPPRNFHFIQPSSDEWTPCYNPLLQRGDDDFFLINAMKIAVVKCWGSDNTQATPRLDEWLRTLFYAGVKLGLTLPELGMLLDPSAERNPQRKYIAEALPKHQTGAAAGLMELCHLAEKGKTTDFENLVGSTKRRLAAFVDNPRLSRIFGNPNLSLDLAELMDQGGTLLVDLSVQGRFHAEDARLFGTLLLTDFYVQMFNRKRVDRPFSLYIDEFQNYATKDLARMLDEARKFNLNLVLAHQRPGQLRNSDSAEDRDLYSAVMTNARNKIVMGGIDPEELEPIVRLLSMGALDPDKIKHEIHTRSVVDYVKEYWEARSRSISHSYGSSRGGSSGSGTSATIGSSAGMGMSYDANGMPLARIMHEVPALLHEAEAN